jgi:hypothetical protein
LDGDECLGPFSVAITKLPEAEYFIKKRGSFASQFWRLKVQSWMALSAHPLVKDFWLCHNNDR